MSTVGAVMDRLYRTFLEPPDHQPAAATLAAAIDTDDSPLLIGEFIIPEDEALMRAGVILELESELVRATSYDEFTGSVSVVRGIDGTIPVPHGTGTRIKLSPPYPRQSVFEAIADNIIVLYPDLYTVRTSHLSTVGGMIAAMEDYLAVEVIEVWGGDHGVVDLGGRMVDFHPSVGGRAVILNGMTGQVWIKYRRRFGSATAETDTLDALGLDPRWLNIVMMGAAADLFAGRDIPKSQTEWVGAVLQAENIPVGTRSQLANAMAQYRARLLDAAKKEMRAEYRTKVRQRQVEIVDAGIGW